MKFFLTFFLQVHPIKVLNTATSKALLSSNYSAY